MNGFPHYCQAFVNRRCRKAWRAMSMPRYHHHYYKDSWTRYARHLPPENEAPETLYAVIEAG